MKNYCEFKQTFQRYCLKFVTTARYFCLNLLYNCTILPKLWRLLEYLAGSFASNKFESDTMQLNPYSYKCCFLSLLKISLVSVRHYSLVRDGNSFINVYLLTDFYKLILLNNNWLHEQLLTLSESTVCRYWRKKHKNIILLK